MIGKLTGILDDTGEDWALIDVSGVGYPPLRLHRYSRAGLVSPALHSARGRGEDGAFRAVGLAA